MYNDVAGGAAVAARIALTAQRDVLVVIDTGGNFHLQRLAGAGLAGAPAGLAGVLDDGAAPAAVGAGLLALHHAKGGALLGHHIAPAAAVRAGLGAGALFAAAAAAVRAGLLPVDGNFFAGAVGGLLEGQDHTGLNVVALAGGVGVGACAAAKAAEAAAENVPENVPQVHAAKAAAEAAGAALARAVVGVHTGKAELVIPAALVRVGQHIVGFVDFLELFLGLFVAGVQVGVVLFRQLAVGAFDLGIAGVLANAEDLIIIAFICHTITLA